MLQKSEPKSRIENDLAAWKRIEDKMVERYGKRIQYDRDFLKAKRDIYRHIRNKYKGSRKLNLYEKAELKVLRGQHRSMMRQLYPNPFVRLARDVLVFSGNLVMLPVRAGASVLKTFFTSPPKAQFRSRQQQLKVDGQQPALRPITSAQKTQEQSKAITRKMPVKARTQMSARQTKSVRL